nr:hypothetical protein [signal crayfish associated tombus-like virus 5]
MVLISRCLIDHLLSLLAFKINPILISECFMAQLNVGLGPTHLFHQKVCGGYANPDLMCCWRAFVCIVYNRRAWHRSDNGCVFDPQCGCVCLWSVNRGFRTSRFHGSQWGNLNRQ